MKQIKLELPDYNLADYVVTYPKNTKDINLNAKVFGDVPAYTAVRVTVYGKPLLAVYANNGQVFFNEGDELSDYKLDNLDLWIINEFYKNGKYYSANNFTFTFAPNGCEWSGEIDQEELVKFHKLLPSGQSPFADFVGFFAIG